MAIKQYYKPANIHEGQNSSVKIQPELDEYAFMHSSAFKNIFGKKQKESGLYSSGGYLKLSNGKHKLYLKYHQLNGVNGDEIRLSYANRSLLGLNSDTTLEIKVKKVNWFSYNWNNRNVDKRWGFRTTMIAFAALFVIEIPALILTIIQFLQ